MYEAMRMAATLIPPDVEAALRKALGEETDALAREHLSVSLENARLAREGPHSPEQIEPLYLRAFAARMRRR